MLIYILKRIALMVPTLLGAPSTQAIGTARQPQRGYSANPVG